MTAARFSEFSLAVCQDCLVFLANGTGPEYLTLPDAATPTWEGSYAAYEARLAQIVAGVEREQAGGGFLSAGGGSFDDDEGEGSFSWDSCDVCNDHLGGNRYAATLLVPVPPPSLVPSWGHQAQQWRERGRQAARDGARWDTGSPFAEDTAEDVEWRHGFLDVVGLGLDSDTPDQRAARAALTSTPDPRSNR